MFEKQIMSPLKQFLINHNFSTFDPNNVIIENKSGISLFDI